MKAACCLILAFVGGKGSDGSIGACHPTVGGNGDVSIIIVVSVVLHAVINVSPSSPPEEPSQNDDNPPTSHTQHMLVVVC